ncbi:hypothetical protein FOZG_18206 [Fusarium oxysporum Fo47]|uniref:Cytochrome P450 oxidoreductase n=1 Tax=Fusarium oxysporum Fo47 TaxID=660027 RepID=W9J7R0_FUSOX|nr:hypothetical protein FOZG_18206 [Fusarium oxysporum Fo47]
MNQGFAVILRPDFGVLAITTIFFIVLYVIYQRLFSPFSNIPGPWAASVSRLWLTWHAYKGDLHLVMMALHKNHGSVVRIAPSEVHVVQERLRSRVYQSAGSKFRKSSWYNVWQGRRKFDLFAEQDEKIHGAQRRLVSRPYAMTYLKDLEPFVDSALHVFIDKLHGMAGQSIDLGAWLQLFAFDVIGELTFSKRFGFLEAGQDDGSFKQIEDALVSASWIGQVPWLYWLHDYLSPVIGTWVGIASRHGTIRTLAAREVSDRLDRGSGHSDILSKLLAVHHEKPDQFDHTALVSMATSNIFAGSDTTAISIRAIFDFLLRNPSCKRRLIDEIDDLQRRGELSDPVSVTQAEKLEYLQAVMYEALRLHPAVGMALPRVVPPGGAEIDGHYMPPGSVVGVNPWVVHRNNEVFGPDVHEFRPERWLKEDTGDMHRFFFAFGSGARMCIGKNISWMEMLKVRLMCVF